MDFLDQLNPAQREAVTYTEGASLIVAGAGSGKTRVLTYRIAYLLQQGVHAANIMALTFTNKAAREMKERIEQLVSPEYARYLWMGTFHSICTRLLRTQAEKLGYTREFTIYDTPDSKSVIRSVRNELGLDKKIYKSAVVLNRISMLKNSFTSPEAYGRDQQLQRTDREMRLYRMYDVYCLYQAKLKAANAMDFDDLLLQMIHLMDGFPEAREQFQKQFKYILVDEYQDTNAVQYQLIQRLAAPQNNICVVGDDAQSIYSFRGADIRNILSFQETYPEARLFKLERNYRSTKNIVNAANSLIHKNTRQIRKDVYSEKEDGSPVSLYEYDSDRQEAAGIAGQIAFSHSRLHTDYEDMAILYRTNAQSRAFEDELRKRNIPYRIYGNIAFYQRKEVKDALAFFRLAVNPADSEALMRAVAFPKRGIGDTTMLRVAETATLNQTDYLSVMRHPLQFGLKLGATTVNRLAAFVALADQLRAMSMEADAFTFVEEAIALSGLKRALEDDMTAEGRDRWQNIEALCGEVNHFVAQEKAEGIDLPTIASFLSEVSLQTDQDDNTEDDTPKVTLMTVHAAKGLEFAEIYIAGLEENLFPSQLCVSAHEIEEERRLFYVAITRAMERCTISYANKRFRNGSVMVTTESRFLKDIDRQYIRRLEPTVTGSPFSSFGSRPTVFRSVRPVIPTPVAAPPSGPLKAVRGQSALMDLSEWKPGDRVTHKVFGDGTVIRAYHDEETDNDKLEVNFDTQGIKQLMLRFSSSLKRL